jgi:hypothetical protein
MNNCIQEKSELLPERLCQAEMGTQCAAYLTAVGQVNAHSVDSITKVGGKRCEIQIQHIMALVEEISDNMLPGLTGAAG